MLDCKFGESGAGLSLASQRVHLAARDALELGEESEAAALRGEASEFQRLAGNAQRQRVRAPVCVTRSTAQRASIRQVRVWSPRADSITSVWPCKVTMSPSSACLACQKKHDQMTHACRSANP